MTKYIYTSIALCCLAFVSHLNAQTASVQTGCIPLTVQFTGPAAGGYFWDFDDGASSDLQNPDHIFTNAGDYNVELYTSQGGTLVGSIPITVYPDLIINIQTDSISGCIPMDVTFSPNIVKDDDITITSYLWTFGDGGSSTQTQPTYTYNSEGVFPVSLKVTTSIGECDKTEVFPDFITVTGVQAKFTSNKFSSCASPDVFTFTNNTDQLPGNTYSWDFGNGETFDGYQPPPINYLDDGLYEIVLSVTSTTGCVSTARRNINIGPPIILFDFDSIACLESYKTLFNNTIADEHIWDFGQSSDSTITAVNTDLANPSVMFENLGEYEVSYQAVSFLGCTSDTTFSLFVDEVNPNFSIGPDVTCGDSFTVILEAEELNYSQYTWIDFNGENSDLVTTSPLTTDSYVSPVRDSFYVNYPDTLSYFLEVTSQFGCTDSLEKDLIIRKPEAYFIPDVLIGIAPLTVNFTDLSFSEHPIVLWEWDYGDGTTESFTSPTNPSHTYTEGGIYYVRLTITNEHGCVDSSELIEIEVIGLADGLGNPGGGPLVTANGMVGNFSICVGDTVEVIFFNPAPTLLDFHFDSDDGRFNHCWLRDTVRYVYEYPGVFPMDYVIEYKDFILLEGTVGDLTVNGAHAQIGYQTDCENIYDVEFESKSINANDYEWLIDGQTVSNSQSFDHTFSSLGRHAVELRVSNIGSNCPPHIDTTSVFIKDIKADFIVEKNLCDSTLYILDASPSIDVHDICHEGYLWNFDFHRPREVGEDTLYHQFPPGRQKIKLTTEDINGCKDSITKWVNVYGATPDFALDSFVCLPFNSDFMDQSIADTTIVDWSWSFGANEQNPSYQFTEADTINGFPAVQLVLTDAIGCMDSIEKVYEFYEPTSLVSINRGPIICVGASVEFSAEDFTEQGSFLNYSWDFGQYGTTSEDMPEITFTDPGETEVNLTFTEASSGCTGDTTLIIEAVPIPIAGFTTSVDSLDVLCHPETIEFSNQSITEGPVFTTWDFGNGVSSGLEDPAITYEKGTYEMSMIVRSVYGCSDTITRSFTLVGPEGEANIDKTSVCIGEEITLSISDTIDVNSYTWDFGDGVTIDNQSPVSHAYTLPSMETNVNLILRTTETGCELVRTIPITLAEVFADFEFGEQNGFCDGEFTLQDLSLGVNSYEWIFGDQSSSSANPTFDFIDPGPINVSLLVSDNATGCEHSAVKEFTLEGVSAESGMPNVFSPNGDQRNDFFNVVTEDPMNQEGVEIIEFKVYNRWGKLIYNNDDPSQGWNGIFNGEPAPAEVYSYYIEYSINGCSNKNIKGNITLVR